MGGGSFAAAPHFLDIGYGPSVACTVGCTWLMYSLCMAHIWPMYDLHMAHIAFRSAIRSAQRTDHQGTLGEKKGDLSPSLTVASLKLPYCRGKVVRILMKIQENSGPSKNIYSYYLGRPVTGVFRKVFKWEN